MPRDRKRSNRLLYLLEAFLYGPQEDAGATHEEPTPPDLLAIKRGDFVWVAPTFTVGTFGLGGVPWTVNEIFANGVAICDLRQPRCPAVIVYARDIVHHSKDMNG